MKFYRQRILNYELRYNEIGFYHVKCVKGITNQTLWQDLLKLYLHNYPGYLVSRNFDFHGLINT